MYQIKEDHQRFLELKRMEADYEHKRNQMIKFYEAVKSAQEVAIDDIPLPSAPLDPNSSSLNPLLPSFESNPMQSILKKSNSLLIPNNKTPPGVPPGPPPILSDIEEDSDEDKSDDEREKSKKIRFSDETQSIEKDSDVNEFLKEIELMEKSANIPNESVSQTIQSIQSLPGLTSHQNSSSTSTHTSMPPPLSIRGKIVPTGGPPPQMMMFRAVPPPGSLRPSTQPPNIQGMLVGRPPIPTGAGPLRGGPPPHRMLGPRPMMPPMRLMAPPTAIPSTVTTSPLKSGDKKTHFMTDRATIEAKPQLRNLSADATRFTPVALRVKREEKGVKKPNQKSGIK